MPLLNRLRFSRREPQNENRRAARLAAPKLSLKLNGLLQTVTPDRTIVYVDGFKISTAENSVTRRESGWIPCRCSKRLWDHKTLLPVTQMDPRCDAVHRSLAIEAGHFGAPFGHFGE